MADYPDIRVEISVEQSFVDIVEERFDAGVRLGESVERDMIAVRIGPDKRMLVAGAPAYFARHGRPATPHELTAHACINLRLPTLGGLYAWEFEHDARPLNVRVGGAVHLQRRRPDRGGRLDGLGLCCLPDEHLAPLVADGRLETVLEDGARPSPATTSTTRAGGSPPAPSPSSWRRCAGAGEARGSRDCRVPRGRRRESAL